MPGRGRLIAFEGGDGSGKSTQTKFLADRIGGVATRQAGGTPFGRKLRELLLSTDGSSLSSRAEALLFMTDRAEHVAALVEPALAGGCHVVSDRWAYSSLAYQGYGRGLDVEQLRSMADWAMNGLWPDLVVLLDVPVELGAERLASRGREQDHFELEGLDFQRVLVDGYHRMAAADPHRWVIVDGSGDADSVAAGVWEAVGPWMSRGPA